MTTYQSIDVLELEPNWRDGISSSHRRSYFRLDPGMGKVLVEDRGGVAATDNGFSWFMEDRTAISDFKTFLAARKGAAVPFWFPTWRQDFQLASDAASVDTTLTISLIGYSKFLSSMAARKYIAIILPDGSKRYRKITNATDPGNGVTETITIDSSAGVALPASTTLISFLLLCRLESDAAKTKFHNLNVAESSLVFREIPKEVP